MQKTHEFLRTVPFDLYPLHLFRLVARHHSFTKAAEAAGVTQSAITRQMQGMEAKLGLDLLERTTRTVRLTAAGEFLHREAERLVGDVDATLRRLREEFGEARPEVRIGVSPTVGLAYLPGFFHANLRRCPATACRVASLSSTAVLAALEAHELDLGVICARRKMPRTVQVTHRFRDAFTLIAPPAAAERLAAGKGSRIRRAQWIAEQAWLLIEADTETGTQLDRWLKRQGWAIEPTMRLNSFDLIINLVALGMGVSFVPIRALALYARKRGLRRVMLPQRFERELAVVTRGRRRLPAHVAAFLENVLF